MSDDWWKEDQPTAAPAAADDSWWQEDSAATEDYGPLLGPTLSEGPRRGRVSSPLAKAFDPYGGYYSPGRGMERSPDDHGVLVSESLAQSMGEDFTLPSGSDWWNSLRGSLARVLQGYERGQLEDIESDILGREYPAFRDGDPTYSRTPAELRELQDDPLLTTVRDKIAGVQAAGREMTTEAQEIAARNTGYWPQVVTGSTNSLALSAPSLAATMTTRNPLVGAAMMFPTTEASAYGEMREQGVPIGTAQKAAAIEGLIEAGTELPALSPFAREASPMLRRFGETVAADIPGETIASLGQSVNRAIAQSDPNAPLLDPLAKGLSEGLGELPVTYGTVLATAGGQSLAAKGIDAARDEYQRRTFKLTPPTPDDIARAETLRAIEALGPMSPGGPFTPDPNVQPELPLGTMPPPALTGSRDSEPARSEPLPPQAAGGITAPSPSAAQGTATPAGPAPLSSAFEPTEPAAPPAPPAPQEPAPAPAPAAPAVSTAQEPPAGEAAPIPVAEESPTAVAALAALKGNPQAHVRRFAPNEMGELTTEDSPPPWQNAGNGWQTREYVSEMNGERYPVQEVMAPGGKRYRRGYGTDGKPFNEVPHNIEEVFDQKFAPAMPTAAPAPAPVAPAAEAPQPGLTPAPTKPKKAPKAKKPEAPPAPAPAPVAQTPAEPEPPPLTPAEETESDAEREKAIREERRKQQQIKKDYKELRKSDPEFNRVAAFVGEEPQHADMGMLQGWRDAKAGVPVDPESASKMLPTADMRPHGFNPVQRYLTGYAAALGLKPHDLRSFDAHEWLTKIADQQSGKPPAPVKKGKETGRREKVVTALGTEVDTEFEVIDAADLITSDSPQFPQELQPRERGSRAVSTEQIAKLAGSIDPESLGSNRRAEHGAPIIGKDDNFVESGNGRVMALRQMYERHPEAAQRYRDFIAKESGQDVRDMKAPILVRRRKSDVNREKFAKEANRTAVAKMSTSEQAKVDQEALTPEVMAKLPDEMGESFELGSGEGLPFVNAFVAKFPAAERGDLVDADGKASATAVQRAKAALLVKAYGGTPAGTAAIRRAVEENAGDARTLVNALVRFAPQFARLRDDIAAGRVQEEADIGSQIAEAVEVARSAGGPGGVSNWLRTDDMLNPKDETVKQLVETFYLFDGYGNAKRLRSGPAIGATLGEYARLAQQYRPEQSGGGLFGDEGAAPTINPAAELGRINEARRAQETRREREETAAAGAQRGLFTAAGKPSEAVSPRPSDAQRGQETRSAGPRESRDESRLETQEAGETDFLADELRRPKRRKSKRRPGPFSMTRTGEIRAAENEQIWTDAGLDPDLMELAPPPVRYQRAVELLQKRFNFREVTKAKNLNWGEAIDAIKDAYVGLTNLAAVQNINPEVMSLNGRLALSLEREHKGALAYYNPGTKTIGMTRRNDAFAHEWAHALDHYLVETFAPEMLAVPGRHLTGKTRAGGVAETMHQQARDAYIAVLNAMYFDGAKAALYIADLEKKIATAKTDKQRLKWQTQLDNFKMGHSKKAGIESEYYLAAKAMDEAGPEGAGDDGYWQRPTEMFARSFEAFIGNTLAGLPAQHPFVTQSQRMYNESRIGTMSVPYPQQADRTNVFAAMETLMRALRDASYVNSGNAPAAILPTDTRYWRKAAPSLPPQAAQQVRGVLAKLAAPFKAQLAELHRADREQRERDKQTQNLRNVKLNQAGISGARRWLANQGLKAIEKINAIPAMLAHSIRGIILGLDGRHAGNQGISWLRSQFATDPGSGRHTGAVWSEEVRHRDKELQNRFAGIVKKHKVYGFNDAELRQLRDVLVNAIPENAVPEKIKLAAADMRRFMNDMYTYNVSNGVEIGYAKNGYLPRIIDALVVENNLDGFRTQARILYAQVYPKEVGTLDSLLRDPLEHPEGLKNIIQYVKEIAKNGNVPEARDIARDLLEDARDLETALQELREMAERGEDTEQLEDRIQLTAEVVYDGLRDAWAMEAANDWEMRIRGLGSEPEFAFEKRGPDGKYTKSRVLPAETDAIMGDFLKNDPLELITTYISQSVRRVEFGKFFGNETKDRKLGWKLDAALHAANRPYRAADGSVQRITADEFEELQKSIELLTGRYNTNMTKKALRWRMKLTAWMTPVILARSLKSQIAEPIVLSIKTGNLSDGFRVFYKQMQDVAAKVGIKGPKQQAAWRREMAEYFGIVADHMADQLMIQRYNLMDLNSADRVKMARFFQIIGVHPHAMSMRRAVADIFMTRYAPQMAQRALKGGAKGKLALQALAELGLDARNADLVAELAQLSNIKDVQQLSSLQYIDQIRTAINRFTDQAVQNPSMIDKPRMASQPEYSFMYGILSFQFAYQRNVLIATWKEINRTWKQDKALWAMASGSALAGFSLLAAGQLAAWIAGMALFSDDDWDDIKDKISEDWIYQSLSRSGMFGAADPIVNSFLSLKYERDLSQIMAGPVLALPLKGLQDLGRSAISDTDTNSASHRAIESLWNGGLTPYVTSKLLSIAGGNRYLDAVLGVGLPFLSSPLVSDWVADTFVGDTNTELKEDAAEGDIDAADELQNRADVKADAELDQDAMDEEDQKLMDEAY